MKAPTSAAGHRIAYLEATRVQPPERRHAMLGAKVFTATKAKDRDELGEVLTRWLRDNPRAKILDKVVTQSSDREFHCLSITIFYEVPA
jgi:hypothetical protein